MNNPDTERNYFHNRTSAVDIQLKASSSFA